MDSLCLRDERVFSGFLFCLLGRYVGYFRPEHSWALKYITKGAKRGAFLEQTQGISSYSDKMTKYQVLKEKE